MAIIENGGKGGGFKAGVTETGRLDVSARTNSRVYYVSRDDGLSFSWHSSFCASTGDEVIYIRNTSDNLRLFINNVDVAGAASGIWELVHETGGTAAGSTITGKNLNFSSGNVAPVTAFGNASVTGTLVGDTVDSIRTVAGTSGSFQTNDGISLGKNDGIFITYTGSGVIEATIIGYFEAPPFP